ncbi:MAG: AcrR family transcriptional regulator [Zhongshania aliphaticivorans]|jgi:AcrR family transcriptional regulator
MIQKITDKHDAILSVAERLFEANGFRATGVDQLATESGVTKRTLYKHFGSKEGLIEAVLRKHQAQLMEHICARVAKIEAGDSRRLLACFDLHQEWFSKPCFAGCLFIKTLNEFQQCSERLFAIATQAKSELRNYLAELAREAGTKDPDLLADQLQLILEGSIVVAQCGRENKSIRIARDMAEAMVSQAITYTGTSKNG